MENKLSVNSYIKISLVIPVIYDDIENFKFLIRNLGNNTKYLFEIIAVIVNVKRKIDKSDFDDISSITNNKLILVFNKEVCFPGKARNIGLKLSRGNYIAFLDVNTIPNSNWIKNSIDLISSEESFLGKTEYQFTNNFEKLFIASTYGFKPLYTVPGSLVKKDLFSKIGWFIPSVRSGEDSDWIKRSLYFSSCLKNPKIPSLKYIGLKDKTFLYLCKKWHKYYIYSSIIQIHQRQKYIYILFATNFLIILSFNWNSIFSNWNINNPFYLPHISKITLITIASLYTFLRIYLIPLKKGVELRNFSVFDYFYLLLISIIIDIVKLSAFVQSSLISLIHRYISNKN